MPKRVQELSPEDELRIRRLLRRCDALSNAHRALELGEWGTGGEQRDEDTLMVLEEMMEEANEVFYAAKRELGLKDLRV